MKEHRVVGPPGCGKTTYLSRQAVQAARKYGPHAVCVASLTKTAAAEVAGRGTGIPRKNIGTLHSHAFRGLDNPEIMETAETIALWNEWAGVSSMRISSKMIANPEAAPPEGAMFETDGDELLQDMGVLRQRMTPRRFWPPGVQRFANKWDEFKKETGALDFTDLIERAIEEVDTLQGNPAVFMVDEAQDMSRLEMTLARKWGAPCEQFVIVGDPDQNLYQWRGSDPDAFYAGEAETERVLEQSYRVPFEVHLTAVRWIEQIEGRQPVKYRPRRERIDDPDSQPAIGRVRTERSIRWEDSVRVVDHLEDDLARGLTVMVLATCNYMLNPVAAELKGRAIPFHNPYRPEHGGWNPMRGARRLLSFLRPSREAWGEESRFWTWDDIKAFTDPMQAAGYMTRGSKGLVASKTRRERTGGERGQDEAEAQAVLKLFEEQHHLEVFDMDVDWWQTSLRHKEVPRQVFPCEIYRKRGPRALREVPRVIVGTIHSVKGGEADVVYLFPDLSNTGFFGSWIKGGEERNSIIRQMYVGMTRAREELVLCGPSSSLTVNW